jgi:hypothetical protein
MGQIGKIGTKKSKIIVDTNILISYFRGDENIEKELELLGFDNIIISAITYVEILNGVKKRRLDITFKILDNIDILHFDSDISLSLTRISKSNSKIGIQTPIADTIIGLAAKQNGYKLYTDNKKDFMDIPGIKFYQTKTYSQKIVNNPLPNK